MDLTSDHRFLHRDLKFTFEFPDDHAHDSQNASKLDTHALLQSRVSHIPPPFETLWSMKRLVLFPKASLANPISNPFHSQSLQPCLTWSSRLAIPPFYPIYW
jgi:hypothetical protein